MDVIAVLAVWLHTVAFVIAWGYYGILGRFVLPALRESASGSVGAGMLMAIERRALPFVLLTVVLFAVTGAYLLVIDPHYAGLGNVFASTWTSLMLAKHVLVVALVVAGVAVDRLIDRVGRAVDDAARAAALRTVSLATEIATALGALIVLLTAAAQASV